MLKKAKKFPQKFDMGVLHTKFDAEFESDFKKSKNDPKEVKIRELLHKVLKVKHSIFLSLFHR
jgi:hypothetical protein